MSDKTPEPSGDDDLEVERPDATGEAADSDVDPAATDETDSSDDDASADKPKASRRTAPAPVRKSTPKTDPEGDDEVIDELEGDFDDAEVPEVTRKTAKAPVRKAAPTKKRSDSKRPEHDPYGPVGPVKFVRQSAAELQKVVWPTWQQLTTYFIAVLVFVLFMIAYVGVLDFAFGWGLLSLLGDS
ncbi:MAG: preprotein translocase subunit SecE [Arachnia sp.]